KSYMLTAGGANLDTAGKIKASKVEFTLSTGVLKITGTTSSNEFDTTKDQGVAFVVNPRGTSPVFVPLTHSYNAEYQTAQYTGTYTVTELGVTAKIGGLTNFNVIDYGTNGQPVMPKFIYDMVKGAYEGFTIEGDYKVGDVLNILVFFDKDWNSSILINVQEAGTNPTPDPTPDPEPEPEPTPGGEITLYYVNKTGWSAVNAYVWDFATGTPIVAWSGEPATKLDKTVDGNEVYSYTFDSSLADRIIFNNGNGGEGNQTQDLTFEASKPYFYDGVWYETLTFDTNGGGTTDPNPDPTPDPEPEPEPDPTVPAFVVAGNGGSDASGIWCNGIEWNPSAEANRMKDADKDGIFEITYSNVPAGTWSFKVVVNTEPVQWLGGDFLDAKNSSAGYTIQDGGNIGFSLSNAADVTIKIDSADGKITLTTPSGNFGKVKIDYFSVVNTDECLVENRFTAANNNTLKYTENIQILEGNEYGYAVYRILGNCNYAVYEKNLLVEVTEAGIYDITIVFNGDYENPDFTITAVKQGGTTDPDTPEDPDTPDGPDTPVGPTPDPTPDPDPVVAIKNLMLQPFEQILPKTTTSTVATFTLQNANTATVSIEGLDADFFEIGEQNIGNGECSISIVFKPIVKGVYYATLVVTTDDEVSLSIDFAAVCGDETFEPGDVPELNPDPVNPGTPDDDINVSVEEVSAIMIYAKEGTIYSEVEFEIYDLAGVNVTKLNGSLQGVYIVKTAEGNRLVSVW
ncbi:MAG: starch-binding protein, partial [Paludibacteraceae bacterium]|nr:starch-binding protein [Paludibacteraceae bacterium]